MSGELSLLAAACQVPDRPLVVLDGEIYTYAGLASRVRPVIERLRTEGFSSATGEPSWPEVALIGETRLTTLILVFALLEVGVPVLMIHPRASAAERGDQISECRPRIVFDGATVERWVGEARCERSFSAPVSHDPESSLAVVRTSGSRGRPKGVVLSRRAFAASASASASRLGWCDEDRWLLSLPLAHVGGLSILTRCLIARKTVVLPSWTRFEAGAVLADLRRTRVTLMSVVPTMLGRLVSEGEPPASLRAVLVGGAAASPALLDRAVGRGWPILTTYGLTESCAPVTLQPTGTVNRGETGSGQPLPGTSVRIVDGVVEIAGPTLMTTYLPRGSVSPITSDGWLRTGDLGFLDDAGNLHVRGRADDVIISGGENVAPLEVESVLEAFPGIRETLIFGVDDEEWGEVVAAILVWEDGASRDLEACREFVRQRLARHARPRRVAILEALPRNPVGKVDRLRATEAVRTRLKPW